jgi:hypothetical protein
MKHVFAAVFIAALAVACQSKPVDTAEAKPDPRQGEEVRQICFSSQIRNWKEHDRSSVIVEKGVRDEYKLDLIGTCRPDDAFMTIGLVTRGGGSCLSWGDTLVTDERYAGGPCSIRKIYKWNEDAAKPADPS